MKEEQVPRKEVVAVLALHGKDAAPMVGAIREVRGEEVDIITVNGPDDLAGRSIDEFVMTGEFQHQRSVRTLLTAIQCQRDEGDES